MPSARKILMDLEPKVPMKKIQVRTACDPKDIDISENMVIYLPRMDSPCASVLIGGDRIESINGKLYQKGQQKQAMAQIAQLAGQEITFDLVRRKSASPASIEFIRKMKVHIRPGFAYFMVNCCNNKTAGKSTIGFTINSDIRRLLVMSVEPGSIASAHFAVGDAFCEVGGQPVDFANPDQLTRIGRMILRENNFIVLVERPVKTNQIIEHTYYLRSRDSEKKEDVQFGPDAVKIGREAACNHRAILCRIKPKSCVTGDAELFTQQTTAGATQATEEDADKKVKVTGQLVESKVASDVDDEDDLRSVDRKSHAADNY